MGRHGPRVAGFLTRPGLDSTLKVTPVENLAPLKGKFSWGEKDTCLRCGEVYLSGIGGAGLLYCGPCQRHMRDVVWSRPVTENEYLARKYGAPETLPEPSAWDDLPEAYRLSRGIS